MSGTVWGRRFAARKRLPALDSFNASIGEDAFLLEAELAASRAYALALGPAGILSGEEAAAVLRGLAAVARRAAAGEDHRAILRHYFPRAAIGALEGARLTSAPRR